MYYLFRALISGTSPDSLINVITLLLLGKFGAILTYCLKKKNLQIDKCIRMVYNCF